MTHHQRCERSAWNDCHLLQEQQWLLAEGRGAAFEVGDKLGRLNRTNGISESRRICMGWGEDWEQRGHDLALRSGTGHKH